MRCQRLFIDLRKVPQTRRSRVSRLPAAAPGRPASVESAQRLVGPVGVSAVRFANTPRCAPGVFYAMLPRPLLSEVGEPGLPGAATGETGRQGLDSGNGQLEARRPPLPTLPVAFDSGRPLQIWQICQGAARSARSASLLKRVSFAGRGWLRRQTVRRPPSARLAPPTLWECLWHDILRPKKVLINQCFMRPIWRRGRDSNPR